MDTMSCRKGFLEWSSKSTCFLLGILFLFLQSRIWFQSHNRMYTRRYTSLPTYILILGILREHRHAKVFEGEVLGPAGE